jgi:hypothetical protein
VALDRCVDRSSDLAGFVGQWWFLHSGFCQYAFGHYSTHKIVLHLKAASVGGLHHPEIMSSALAADAEHHPLVSLIRSPSQFERLYIYIPDLASLVSLPNNVRRNARIVRVFGFSERP